MTLLIEGGTVATLGRKNSVIFPGGVVIEGDTIKDVGPLEEIKIKYSSADVIQAKGKLILPSFVNVHHHLYSTFARGLSIPGAPPENFIDILEGLWWKLDNTLFHEAIYYSSIIPLIECVKHGVTAVIDHHESQSCQMGSLDEIKKAVDLLGIRAVLCLGSSDRYGKGDRGIEENERFLRKKTSNVKGMVGLHASFTVEDKTLMQSIELAKEFNVGIHVHCAEDIQDQRITREKYSKSVIRRFADAGLLGEKSLLVHCIHLDEDELNIIRETNTSVVHNPESNMNNAVGYSRALDMFGKGIKIGIGTDGMSSDMLSQMRCAFLLSRHQLKKPNVGFLEFPDMLLKNNAEILNRVSGWQIGEITPGSSADVVIADYIPPTPLNENNIIGHILFGLVSSSVEGVICNGKIIMQDRKIVSLNEDEICLRAREAAVKVWEKLQ